MQTAAIIRPAQMTEEHVHAYLDAIIYDLDAIIYDLDAKDGRETADLMDKQEVADILVQHGSVAMIDMISQVSPEWAQALSAAQGKFIRIH